MPDQKRYVPEWDAVLALADGKIFRGKGFGADVNGEGEVVFTTSMTGYQEVCTDPSFRGQIVCMTYPIIGNYGVTDEDNQSRQPWIAGLVVREIATQPSNWHMQGTLDEYLKATGVPGIAEIDTRALTRHIRSVGDLRAVLVHNAAGFSDDELVNRAKKATLPSEHDVVGEVMTTGEQQFGEGNRGPHVVVLDCGVKMNIIHSLTSRGARVTVLPYGSSYARVRELNPDGVAISPGPGDPANLDDGLDIVRAVLDDRRPYLGICLGHQLLARAIGADTEKLKFGHRGGNQPIRDERSGRVTMTTQNHSFQVRADSVPTSEGWQIALRNLNDNSVEGLAHDSLPVLSVQFHPEAAPGPADNGMLFDEFLEMISGKETNDGGRTNGITQAQKTGVAKPASVLVIGSGPIIIGQAAEFDYAGTQACQSLREEGIRTILVNSNPATIMTDEDVADAVYIEPLTPDVIRRVIQRERPEGLLPTLGGQTGLNLAVQVAELGILDQYNVRLLGTPLSAIQKAEDRELFRDLLNEIGEPAIESEVIHTIEEAREFITRVPLPLVIRPAYTLGGTGGGVAYNEDDLDRIVASGLRASPIQQVLLERSLLGWKEVEYEVMRDSADTCITICNMENIDPMGVHTGDSIVVAPSQTLSDREYQMLRSSALNIIRTLGIEGGCNVQYALNPDSMEYGVIEVNPRVSRSSALASKATGYPIARISAKIAIGKRLDELTNVVTGKTTAAFEPALDYVVAKIPRWPFDKFPQADRSVTTQMKATGEVMAIDRSFEGAIQKAARSLETNAKDLLWEDPDWDGDMDVLTRLISKPTDIRLWAVMAALRRGMTVEEVHKLSAIDKWFLWKFERIVIMERTLARGDISPETLWDAKQMGFSDRQIGVCAGTSREDIRSKRRELGMSPVYKMVDTCAGEFEALTPYFYSTYEEEDEATPLEGDKAVVVGSGPIRIGQGIEFDYCSVQAARALQASGWSSIMVNSNPETVSTDFDASDRLYFEPLDPESVEEIMLHEAGGVPADMSPMIVQFGGQTAINLARPLSDAGAPIRGSSLDSIDLAEDRERFEAFLNTLGIPQPPGATVTSLNDAEAVAQRIGYPVLVRPSYVLGGRAMEVVHSPDHLARYIRRQTNLTPEHPILIDKYLIGKEVEVDAICDDERVLIPGIMEHIERAGVHSGDSFAAYPAINLFPAEVERIVDYTTRIALGLNARGLVNIQYVIHAGHLYVIEVNPRSSRTVPFLSKATGVPMVKLATNIMLGKTLEQQGYDGGLWPRQPLMAVKAPVFSMAKLRGVEVHLGPEMKSTGEVMGIDRTFASAFFKALIASGLTFPRHGSILVTLADEDKVDALPMVTQLARMGYKLYATEGTAAMIERAGVPVQMVTKRIGRGSPDMLDVILNGTVDGVINTPGPANKEILDGLEIRRAAVERGIPCITSVDTARTVVDAMEKASSVYSVEPIEHYRRKAFGY